METQQHSKVQKITIDTTNETQRIDRFLCGFLAGVPKSRIFSMIRRGEVRVNGKRVKVGALLHEGDVVRVPPAKSTTNRDATAQAKSLTKQQQKQLHQAIVHDEKFLLVLNKPAGLAVHAGSGIRQGLIEQMRLLLPDQPFLELVHRIDRETSGCLVLAKRRSWLRFIHEELRERRVRKCYFLLVHGAWKHADKWVCDSALNDGAMRGGERTVKVSDNGKEAKTEFHVVERFGEQATLLKAYPLTGRTHQIRVHAQSLGHPIVGDAKYGNESKDSQLLPVKCKLLFLHAFSIYFSAPPGQGERYFECQYSKEWVACLEKLRHLSV